jgi:serine protease inhibitor
MAIASAIYFRGKWKVSFDKEMTNPENFQLSKDKEPAVTVQMMNRMSKLSFAETDDAMIVDLPFDVRNDVQQIQ